MTIIPQIKLYNEHDTPYIHVDCTLKTLTSGNMVKSLDDVSDVVFWIDDEQYSLKTGKDNSHWYSYVNYTKFEDYKVLRLEIIVNNKSLKFNV